MKSKFLLVFFLYFSVHFIVGQTFTQLKTLAEEYYNTGRFQESIDFYERLHQLRPNDTDIHFLLAMSNYNAHNYSKAKSQFLSILNSGIKKNEVIYHYGLLLKIGSEYEKADSVFHNLQEQIIPSNPLYDLTKLQREGCRLALRQLLTNNTRDYRLVNDVNSTSNDFGPTVHPITGNLYISSSRKTKQKQFLDSQYGGFLPNVLSFNISDTLFIRTEDADILNSPWSEASGSFSRDGKSFYYTSCTKNDQCKIMISRLDENEKWTEGVPLNDAINFEGYGAEHPSISATGDTLFFASNRPGGEGGKDIWMSLKISEDEWMAPINMGATINTAADEITPFYSSSFNALLFSSDGHAGYGGFDLYMGKGVSFYSPLIYNLGLPFNSPQDDTFFTLGFSASNRGNSFNIYQYDYKNEYELFSSFLAEESLIQFIKFNTNSLSLESFRIEDYKGYNLFDPEKRDYIDFSKVDSHTNITGLIGPNKVVKLRISDEIEIVTISEEDGSYEFRLLPDTVTDFHVKVDDDIVEASKEGYTYNYFEYDFEKIYFDFNSDLLRDESIETLIDLISQFDVNNIVLVDVHTHADHVGNAAYNFELSEQRGLSVLRKLNEMGIPFHQMRVFANGEDNPLSKTDSWYGRLFNRRAELVVYTKNPVTFIHPEVFLVRRDISVDQVSSSLRIESDKLKEWNGLKSATLQEGHVLRVFNPNHLTPNLRYIIPETYLDKNLQIYTVKKGDSIQSIAQQFNIVEEVLIETNHLEGQPTVGMEIVINR